MNVGQIKAFLGDQKASVNEQKAAEHPEKALKKQLQQDGLRQAAEMQQKQVAMVSVSSSQSTIGLKVFSSSLEQYVVVDGRRFKEQTEAKEGEEKSGSLFDFEKVARNVMRFVGGVIQGAADSGADKQKLGSLFSQAREGVAKGIAMAEKDIGGLMNSDISEGISKSRDLIGERLDNLESRLLGNGETQGSQSVSQVGLSTSDAKSASLTIRTKDGDEVALSFESLRAFQYNSQFVANQPDTTTVSGNSENPEVGGESNSQTSLYQYFERQGISFSLKGELDEDELKAIADLVTSADDLADTFFGGDLDKAFEQALELGYNDQELAGYALQLNRVQQTEVVQAYGSIQHYNDANDTVNHGDAARPVAQYLDKMLNVFDMAGKELKAGEDYNTLINGLISEMKDVQVPDLVSAINRFHSFNQRLLEAMPGSQQATQPVPEYPQADA